MTIAEEATFARYFDLFDVLHAQVTCIVKTYQGNDVALIVRRKLDRLENYHLIVMTKTRELRVCDEYVDLSDALDAHARYMHRETVDA